MEFSKHAPSNQPEPASASDPTPLDVFSRPRGALTLLALATIGILTMYLVTGGETYEGEATVIVEPIPASSEFPLGLGLFRQSSIPTQIVKTAAELLITQQSAELAAEQTGLSIDDPTELLEGAAARPIGSTNVIAVTARARSPRNAATAATGLAEAAIELRAESLADKIDTEIARLKDGEFTPKERLQAQDLARLARRPTPDLALGTRATPPDEAVAGWPLGVVIMGALALLTLAVVAVWPYFGKRRVHRSLALPVLARVSVDGGFGEEPLSWDQLSREATDGLGELATAITEADEFPGHVIALTGVVSHSGTTTTAVNLAEILARRHRVILIEANLTSPSIARTLELKPEVGTVSTLIERTTLEEGLIDHERLGRRLRVLPVERSEPWLSGLLGVEAMQTMLRRAGELADWVLIDTPPLQELLDHLPFSVDSLILMVREDSIEAARASDLGAQLARSGATVAGTVLTRSAPGRD